MGSKSGGCNSSTRDDKNIINNINKNNVNMNKKGGLGERLDDWRQYFKRVNSDIFDIIEHAIMVAASDCPKEYRVRKAGIAELLFSCRMTRCIGCDRVELATCHHGDGEIDDHGGHDDDHSGGAGGGDGSKVDSISRDDGDDDVGGDDDDSDDDDDDDDDVEIDIVGGGNEGREVELNDNMVDPASNISYGEAEALTDLIEEERDLINEVLRIKDILYNSQDESDSVLFESLRRLQLMHLTINILKETEIGKAVNGIRRHSSKDIRHLARSLIDGWKVIVDEWVKSTQDLAGGTPDSINPSTVDEEEGLPSPPMDEGAFFSTQPMDFDQIFDGMDDDGNFRNPVEFNNNREAARKPSAVKPDAPKRREEPPKQATPISKDNRAQEMKTQKPLLKPAKPSNMQLGPGRSLKPNGDVKPLKDSRVRAKPENPPAQRRPTPQPQKPRPVNEDSVQEKLEATKRKLQERYQQAENAKRQRTIQVMEIHDLPKQGLVNKNPHAKFGNHNRNWANGRK
ncbi:putative mediator of RNA polymerase II transcription subunit 26b isoform X3 [Silene latifolia]|uniref:putative mediator of RNA polymerase II transcription subunit 26b isoform X3 n=1 Tax=Silene latifolia TaxID=37657 RepID=UPI003D78ACE3